MKVAQSGAPTTTITDASSTVYRGSDLRLLLDVTDGRAESGGAGEPLWDGEGATGRQSGGEAARFGRDIFFLHPG